MIYFNAFIFAGLICMLGQIILDNTKLTPGHITSLFVIIGSFLDVFDLYDRCIKWAGGGALVPITSFGHSLVHGAIVKSGNHGIFGIFMGMFDLTAPGIVAALVFSFFLTMIFRAKD